MHPILFYTQQKKDNLEQVVENSIEQYFAATHCSRLLTVLNSTVTPDSGLTMLFNTVKSLEQCGQQNIADAVFINLNKLFILAHFLLRRPNLYTCTTIP